MSSNLKGSLRFVADSYTFENSENGIKAMCLTFASKVTIVEGRLPNEEDNKKFEQLFDACVSYLTSPLKEKDEVRT